MTSLVKPRPCSDFSFPLIKLIVKYSLMSLYDIRNSQLKIIQILMQKKKEKEKRKKMLYTEVEEQGQ